MRIIVSVITRAAQERVEKIGDGMYKVRVHAAPEKNKANYAVVQCIARYFNVPQKNVTIVAGRTARKKMIDIKDVDA